MILILSGLSTDLFTHNKIIKNVTIPNGVFILKEKFQKIDQLFLDPQTLDLSLKFSSILFYWINSFSMKQIREYCNLKSQSYLASIEEVLIKDAYRTLLGIFSIAESIMNNEHNYSTERVEKVLNLIKMASDFCNDGTNDRFVKSLIHSGVNHMGRATALKLKDYLQDQQKNLLSLSENEFKNIFPNNTETAKSLYNEIHKFEDYFIISNSDP